MFAASKSGSVDAKDPQFKNVTMLLHGNGTNGAQNNTFVDSSSNNFTITRNGNTTQGTFSPYGSNWSNYFDGSGDRLDVANNAALQLNSGNFTMEAWVYYTTATSYFHFFSKWNAGDLEYQMAITTSSGIIGTSTSSNGSSSTGDTTSSAGAVSPNVWQHVAWVRNGATDTLYVNGVSVASNAGGTIRAGTSALSFGGRQDGAYYGTGYLSNARLVKGTALYTGSFTPSTTPLTAITNTSLLTCQSNRFIDNSSNAFTITKNGDVSVQRFSPFSPTTAYSTSVIGGSGYFDGSGDYLSVATASALDFAGDFTVEAWVYVPTTSANARTIVHKADTNVGYGLVMIAAGNIEVQCTSLQFNSTSTLPLNQWNHVAMVRNGSGTNNVKFYLNGVLDGQGTNTTNTSSSVTLGVGAVARSGAAGVNPLNGYISNVREVASAVYTANFTPPTAPLTAISGTSLLLNNTNAGILDNAMMNDLETVGNAQISTSVKKYGTGSMYFDGTGDWLQAAGSPNPIRAFNTGDFTVEMWVYPTQLTSSTDYNIIDFRSGGTTTGFRIGINGSTIPYVAAVGGILNGSFTFSTNTWYHFAVTRSSGTLTIWINGTSAGSNTTTTNFTDSYLLIGSSAAGNIGPYFGYIDDLRITKGVARYTSNFTVPSSAFPDKG